MIELLLGLVLAIAAPLGLRLALAVATPVDRTSVAGRAIAVAPVAAVPAVIALALPRGLLAASLVVPWLSVTIAIGLFATWSDS